MRSWAFTDQDPSMSFRDERLPLLDDTRVPPTVRGTADLTTFAYQHNNPDDLLARIHPVPGTPAALYDAAIALQLGFQRARGLQQLEAALAQSTVFRIAGAPPDALRLLALVTPGDLMANVPLDFLTNHLNVRLDLLYVLPGQPLPPVVPDHDVAFFAAGLADPPMLARLRWLYAAWPRPALNNPVFLPAQARDTLSHALAGIPGLCSPTATAMARDDLAELIYPCLIRPFESHAGADLELLRSAADRDAYLLGSAERQFFVTAFHDYSSPDGLYRKSRIAFIDRQPFLCHLAISSHWMVHYLNAGMTESPEKRAEEAQAMAAFDTGFARRHDAAFQALHRVLGFDYYSIDCAETRDGRLLVFEADAAAIVHMMDPPGLFPYKQPQMRKMFAAFDALLRRRAAYPRMRS